MNPILEAGKEFLRVVLLAAIPIVIDGLTQGEISLSLVAVTAAIAGLRFIDKALHEAGKEADNEVLKRGLTQF